MTLTSSAMATMSTAAALASTEIEPTPTGLSKLSNNTSSDVTTDQKVLETSIQAVIACNSISVAACVIVIVIYALLHRKYTRVMQRTSLVLSCAMATADLLLHVSAPLDRNMCERKTRRATIEKSLFIASRYGRTGLPSGPIAHRENSYIEQMP